MGVINVTPDSFSDGGLSSSTETAIQHALHLIKEGADILDIGGESSRPGSAFVSVEEELNRVIPVIQALANMNIPISVDTSKPEVMQRAIEAGVTMVNDVNALRAPGALEIVANSDVLVCLMHMQGKPNEMQKNPQYMNVVDEVLAFLQQRLETAQTAGISMDRLVIDPGFGFGKTLEHNLQLLRHLDHFTKIGVPVLAGISRKSMLGAITGNKVDQRIHESVAAALLAVVKGANILRVHDVKATKDAISVYTAMNNDTEI
ncbi:MAG: dihydropteroate synthase [Nitrosomonas sp.]|nr:dihydropteroate synthase [Nitrosomonas sp.]MDP1949927.1 dihydropteroate synthase [Nitrosomonas sp.]